MLRPARVQDQRRYDAVSALSERERRSRSRARTGAGTTTLCLERRPWSSLTCPSLTNTAPRYVRSPLFGTSGQLALSVHGFQHEERVAVRIAPNHAYAIPSTSAEEKSSIRTVPAPPERPALTTEVRRAKSTEARSSRPTSAPDFDLEAFADASCAPTKLPALPEVPSGEATPTRASLELVVPVRTDQPLPERLDHWTLFVLLHVDGVSTIGEIAREVARPGATASLLELVALGIVKLRARCEERRT